VLPATTFWERTDVHARGDYAIFMKQASAPMYECRNDLDICRAAAWASRGYNDETELDWLRAFTADAVDVDAFMDNGGVRFSPRPDAAAFVKQIRNPERHRFTAPCKIDVHSMALAANPAVELGAARQRQNRGIRGGLTLGACYASCRERRTA
jgi:anaerobic dimethyl sulfoxide reductase subunit A